MGRKYYAVEWFKPPAVYYCTGHANQEYQETNEKLPVYYWAQELNSTHYRTQMTSF